MASRLLLLQATLALLYVAAAGQKDNKIMKPLNTSCSTTDNYTDGSQYKNLDQLLVALPTGAGDNGWFYNGSAGAEADDEVFDLIMYYADYNATQCLDCLARAPAGITRVCPGSRNVSTICTRPPVLGHAIPATVEPSYLYRVHVIFPGVLIISSEELLAAWVPVDTQKCPDICFGLYCRVRNIKSVLENIWYDRTASTKQKEEEDSDAALLKPAKPPHQTGYARIPDRPGVRPARRGCLYRLTN